MNQLPDSVGPKDGPGDHEKIDATKVPIPFTGGTPGEFVETLDGKKPVKVPAEVAPEAEVASKQIGLIGSDNPAADIAPLAGDRDGGSASFPVPDAKATQIAAETVKDSAQVSQKPEKVTRPKIDFPPDPSEEPVAKKDQSQLVVTLPNRTRWAMFAVAVLSLVLLVIGTLAFTNVITGIPRVLAVLLISLGISGLLLGLLPLVTKPFVPGERE